MCGGLVAFATASTSAEQTGQRRLPVWRPSWVAHVSYHGGRLLAYAVLGSFAGGLGSALNLAGSLAGVSNVTAVIAAATIIAWALASLAGTRWRPRGPALLQRAFSGAMGRLRDLPSSRRALALGLATGLLPCGWLYAFVVTAAGTGSMTSGALLMASFWLGSVPALVGVGSLAQLVSHRLRRHLPALSAAVLLAVGLANLWTRYSAPADLAAVAAASAEPERGTRHSADDHEVLHEPSCH
jgi:sulfite exporter TauE/SafE